MDKGKFLLIILGILFVVSAVFAFLFYSRAQELLDENAKLQKAKQSLEQENSVLGRNLQRKKRENVSLKNKIDEINKVLTQTQTERDKYYTQYNKLSDERENLLSEIKKLKEEISKGQASKDQNMPSFSSSAASSPSAYSDKYWKDVLVEKAELESRLDDTLNKFRDVAAKLNKVQQENKDIQDKWSRAQADISELKNKLVFNQRTIDSLSEDLLKERIARRQAEDRLRELKRENISLRSDYNRTLSMKQQMEDKLKQTYEDKMLLEKKVKDIEDVLQEQSQGMEDIYKQISSTVKKTSKGEISQKAKAVELPPIVVKPDTKPYISRTSTSLQGKVMIVNNAGMLVGIDLGTANGLKSGDKLVVLRNNKKIADLSVVKTQEHVSVCDIEDVIPGESIKEGDIVSLLSSLRYSDN